VSQYVAHLNTIPPAQEPVAEPLNIDEDLALFTNSEFIEWDVGSFDLDPPLEFNVDGEQRRRGMNASGAAAPAQNVRKNENKPLDFVNSDFQFVDFGFQTPVVEQPMPNLQQHSRTHSYPVPPSYTSPVSTAVSPVTPHFDFPTDEAARVAAEEDKRRRNTAASARFRVKKKQREQALEKTAKEMTERVNVLESRINQLEMENNWLKSLITEKNEKSSPDISAMYKKFTEDNAGERSTGGRTDGVGTDGKGEKAEA